MGDIQEKGHVLSATWVKSFVFRSTLGKKRYQTPRAPAGEAFAFFGAPGFSYAN